MLNLKLFISNFVPSRQNMKKCFVFNYIVVNRWSQVDRPKSILLTIALVLIPAFVLAAPGTSQFCKENDDFGVSHGTCVSTVQACIAPPGNDFLTITPLCICKFLRAAFPDDYREIVGN